MSFLIHNDKLVNSSEHEILLNRGFLYGDGFFETIRVYDSMPLWLNLHEERIEMTLEKLKMKKSPFLAKSQLSKLLWDIIEANKVDNGRLRLNVFRDSEGYYLPKSHDTSLLISAEQLSKPLYELNHDGLFMGLSEEVELPQNFMSSLKTFGRLNQVLASIEAQERGFDDLFVKNTAGNIAEATSSNVIVINGNLAITPPKSEGAIFGVMRSVVLKNMKKLGLDHKIRPITSGDLLHADEIWLTNSVRGIQWVAGYKDKRFFCNLAKKMSLILQQSVM